ncbi:large subunit GTPase 1 homolog [Artemia franciscana]|uniref:large subunit GTPase 1 homolog n=1 Tax=Artemia franciscana TaxID=6661 RepID=UPI0032D9FEA7
MESESGLATSFTELNLKQNIAKYFLEWRKTLSQLQEIDGIVLTPYAKNLEFWRQLWRVIEKSDVIVQILDAPNLLLFRCEDLENYIKDVSQYEKSMLLLNKSDFLTEKQRRIWAQYFADASILVVFYSAANEKKPRKISEESGVVSDDADEEKELSEKLETLELKTQTMPENSYLVTSSKTGVVNDCRVLTKEELVKKFTDVYTGPKEKKETVIGLVGYPNVGKISTINSLISTKKVFVSSTPEKTKHFQNLQERIIPKSQKYNEKERKKEIRWICAKRKNFYQTYNLSKDLYKVMPGFMNARGLPDHPRATWYIRKDCVTGKILYCPAPPGSDQESFHTYLLYFSIA